MKLVLPYLITEANLAATNIASNPHPEYDSGHTYQTGDWIKVTSGGYHRVYRSVKDANTGNNPLNENLDPDVAPTNWAYAGATNDWALFDPNSGASSNDDLIDITLIDVGRVQAIALLGLVARSIEIVVKDSAGNIIYQKAQDLIDSSIINGYWDWFYANRRMVTDLVLSDLPMYVSASIQIIIRNTGNKATIRNLVLGKVQEIGGTRRGAEVGITDYGVKKRDVFGNLYMLERGFSKRNALDVWVDAGFVDELNNLLAEYRSKPIVWINAPGYQSMIIYGVYNKFRVVISLPRHSIMTIDIEGFI